MARRAGPSLDRTAVSAAAAELADREGLGGVTLATVAARLGVRTPSLYNHVAGLPGLRRELALLGLRELGQRMGRAVVGKADDRALEAIAHAYRAYAHEHPGVYAAAQQVPAAGDAAWEAAGAEVVGIVRAVLAGYGLEGDDALHATRGLRGLLHGFVSLETGGGFGLPLDLDESFRRLLQVFMAGLRVRS
jgi:AcrR family transcriptional regulator